MHSLLRTHVRDIYKGRVDIATDAAEAVRKTMETPGWKLVQEVLAAEVETIDRRTRFQYDDVETQAVYAARIGYRTGLVASQDAAEELCRVAADLEREFEETKQSQRAPAEGRA